VTGYDLIRLILNKISFSCSVVWVKWDMGQGSSIFSLTCQIRHVGRRTSITICPWVFCRSYLYHQFRKTSRITRGSILFFWHVTVNTHIFFFGLSIFITCIFKYSWLSLSRIRLTRISGWVEFLSKSRTSLWVNLT
jgi:hypothetical protein